jgi:hypothetical protein
LTVSSASTSQQGDVAIGTASMSASGNLTYQFVAVPGGTTGKTPVVAPSGLTGEALVYFNQGPGNYSVQLTVTDGAGNTSTSAPVTITYTGS